MDSNLVGKTLARKYRITESLNVLSGQGDLYYGQDITTSIEKKCIVKRFKRRYESQGQLETAKRLFDQEAQVLQKLGQHSQIPEIIDYFEENGDFYLVQQLIIGQNLQEEFQEKQNLEESDVKQIIKDVLEVLTFVHKNNYIHRDIKPSNLIRNDFDNKIYLIDFGAVKEKIDPNNIDSRGEYTRTICIGTPNYSPEEQRLGRPEFCSDIYALGIVAIQALTGINLADLTYDENQNPLWRREHLLTHNYNLHFLDIIDKMVVGNYRNRYQSAREVLADLNNLPEDNSNYTAKQTKIKIPEANQSKFSKNSFIYLLLFIILTGFGIWYFLFSQAAKGKLIPYNNDEYGISLDYPETWSLQEENDFFCPGVTVNSDYENNNDNFRERVKVCVQELISPLSLSEYTQFSLQEIKEFNSIVEQPKTVTLANRKGTQVVYEGNQGRKVMEVWTVKNKKAYRVIYSAEKDKYSKFLGRAKTIIKSLEISN